MSDFVVFVIALTLSSGSAWARCVDKQTARFGFAVVQVEGSISNVEPRSDGTTRIVVDSADGVTQSTTIYKRSWGTLFPLSAINQLKNGEHSIVNFTYPGIDFSDVPPLDAGTTFQVVAQSDARQVDKYGNVKRFQQRTKDRITVDSGSPFAIGLCAYETYKITRLREYIGENSSYSGELLYSPDLDMIIYTSGTTVRNGAQTTSTIESVSISPK